MLGIISDSLASYLCGFQKISISEPISDPKFGPLILEGFFAMLYLHDQMEFHRFWGHF